MKRECRKLAQWKFAVGETKDCLNNGRVVKIPHTWNVEEGFYEYAGSGWYECLITVSERKPDLRTWLEFGAVYHDAWIYVNDHLAGQHLRSGYTSFTVEISDYLQKGENRIVVRADNSYGDEVLPYRRSFDWANDGGIIRDVFLYTTGKGRIASICTVNEPILTQYGKTQRGGSALWGFGVEIDGSGRECLRGECNEHKLEERSWDRNESENGNADSYELKWKLIGIISTERNAGGDTDILSEGTKAVTSGSNGMEREILPSVEFWHFDRPRLYTLEMELFCGEALQDVCSVKVGFRKLETCSQQMFLNGEPVRLCGTEWMPGSDPAYGTAEPREQLYKMLRILKDTNCVFTRFHWQQSQDVYDWCDENGMLVQEEVPFWGPDPEAAGELQWDIFRQQMEEMVREKQTHPSLVAWGVGNELTAQHPDTIRYIKRAIGYTRKLDSQRIVNYVSNSYFREPGKDGVQVGALMMLNEYTGTWIPGYDAKTVLEEMSRENPHKPIVISEFGLCEPAFSGGDEFRGRLFQEKMGIYRQFPNIAGTINFCLNDYRTQLGEEGEGAEKRRVHGSTDLQGRPKGSYWTVQRECAPCRIVMNENECIVVCRNDLPCYAMEEYRILIKGTEGTQEKELKVLSPGETLHIAVKGSEQVTVYRPGGGIAVREMRG